MYIKTEKGRDFFTCDGCKKPFSFRSNGWHDRHKKYYCADCMRKNTNLMGYSGLW